jgi:hypothetical protein
MKRATRSAVAAIVMILNVGSASAQTNTPTPKAEDAEKHAFDTPNAGKAVPSPENKSRQPDANPESRQNDDPPPQDRTGSPNASPK